MTVAQLRKALRGLAPDTPVVLWDNYLIDIYGQAEVGITSRGTTCAVRLIPTRQISRLQKDLERLKWETAE